MRRVVVNLLAHETEVPGIGILTPGSQELDLDEAQIEYIKNTPSLRLVPEVKTEDKFSLEGKRILRKKK